MALYINGRFGRTHIAVAKPELVRLETAKLPVMSGVRQGLVPKT